MGAVVSTVLLAVAFALVLSFQTWLGMPRNRTLPSSFTVVFLDFTRPAPTAGRDVHAAEERGGDREAHARVPEKSVSTARSPQGRAPHCRSVRVELILARLETQATSRDVPGHVRAAERARGFDRERHATGDDEARVVRAPTSETARQVASVCLRPRARDARVSRRIRARATVLGPFAPFVELDRGRPSRARGRRGVGRGAPRVQLAHADIQLDMGPLRKFLFDYPASSYAASIGDAEIPLRGGLLLFGATPVVAGDRSPRAVAEAVVRRAEASFGVGPGRGDVAAVVLDAVPQPFFDGGGD